MIGWVKNLPVTLRYYYHHGDLDRMNRRADRATHREYVQRTMTKEICKEYERYKDSLDFDSSDWKTKTNHHFRPEMEEEDRCVLLQARLEHLMFLAQSMMHQAKKSVKLAEERVKANSIVADEYRRLGLETEEKSRK